MSPDVARTPQTDTGRPAAGGGVPPPGYGAVLEIDLGAVAANYAALCKRTGGVEVAATVKADAYGLGLDAVAPALAAAGATKFFVATVAEGTRLRALLPDAEIYVLNGYDPAALASIDADRLIPALNSLAELAAWRAAAPRRARAILHLDTGMNRLGLDAEETAQLLAAPACLEGLALDYVISHLACADEPDHPMNDDQLRRFAASVHALRRCTGSAAAPGASLAGSSGIFLGPAYHFDLTRPGAALYGLAPVDGRPSPMRPVVRLSAKILQLRVVDSSMTVGYGAAHKVRGERKIATISAGYADGYPRSAGPTESEGHAGTPAGSLTDTLTDNGAPDGPELAPKGRAWIAGTMVPIVGRVSMDLITLDVTAAPAASVRPGAPVELIGDHITADDVAAAAGTIGYEVLTGLGHRAWRTYRNAPADIAGGASGDPPA